MVAFAVAPLCSPVSVNDTLWLEPNGTSIEPARMKLPVLSVVNEAVELAAPLLAEVPAYTSTFSFAANPPPENVSVCPGRR